MHHTAARRPPGTTPAGPTFDQMACPAVVEAGKLLVGGRISPRQFDAVVEAERAAWERRMVAPVAAVPPRR